METLNYDIKTAQQACVLSSQIILFYVSLLHTLNCIMSNTVCYQTRNIFRHADFMYKYKLIRTTKGQWDTCIYSYCSLSF